MAQETLGASINLVVFNVVMLSGMYRLVMGQVDDGSGGRGLTEDRLGP